MSAVLPDNPLNLLLLTGPLTQTLLSLLVKECVGHHTSEVGREAGAEGYLAQWKARAGGRGEEVSA